MPADKLKRLTALLLVLVHLQPVFICAARELTPTPGRCAAEASRPSLHTQLRTALMCLLQSLA